MGKTQQVIGTDTETKNSRKKERKKEKRNRQKLQLPTRLDCDGKRTADATPTRTFPELR